VTSRLDLQVDVADGEPVAGWHELLLLIDGADLLAEAWEGMGRDPDDLLGPESPLIARIQPQDVTLLRCTCGEEGCGSLVGRVRLDGDAVVWDHFRDGPRGRRVEGLSEVRFDATQYQDELDRADRDRGWESSDRTAARLVRDAMIHDQEPLAAEGWLFAWSHAGTSETVAIGPQGPAGRERPGFAVQTVPGVEVSLTNQRRQIVLGFAGATQDPVQRAEQIVELLRHGDPHQWPVNFKGGTLEAWPSAEQHELGPFGTGPFRG
jgi:hypothetical protein